MPQGAVTRKVRGPARAIVSLARTVAYVGHRRGEQGSRGAVTAPRPGIAETDQVEGLGVGTIVVRVAALFTVAEIIGVALIGTV